MKRTLCSALKHEHKEVVAIQRNKYRAILVFFDQGTRRMSSSQSCTTQPLFKIAWWLRWIDMLMLLTEKFWMADIFAGHDNKKSGKDTYPCQNINLHPWENKTHTYGKTHWHITNTHTHKSTLEDWKWPLEQWHTTNTHTRNTTNACNLKIIKKQNAKKSGCFSHKNKKHFWR